MSFEEKFVRFVLGSAIKHGDTHDHAKAGELLSEFNDLVAKGSEAVGQPVEEPAAGTEEDTTQA